MRLVYQGTSLPVLVGHQVALRNGEECQVTYFRKPTSPASEGKVTVRNMETGVSSEYYVSVIGAEWIEREDRM